MTTPQAAAVQESKTPIVDAAELARDKMIANRFIGRQGEQKDLPNPWDIARQLELALAASQEREGGMREYRSLHIYKPYGTYFRCRLCGQTWWGDGNYLDRGENHKHDCGIAIIDAALAKRKP